jgi:hypothetical protein
MKARKLQETCCTGCKVIKMPNTELSSPNNLGTKLNWRELEKGSGSVVFLVNGFGGCAPCITRNLHKKLQSQGIFVYDVDWNNDVHRRRSSVYLRFSTSTFIRQMVNEVIAHAPSTENYA